MSSKRDPGPFLKTEFIPDKHIQRFALAELAELKLLPTSPGPVLIDQFSDRKWGMPEDYEKLETGVLGYAAFTIKGFDHIVINRDLDDDTTVTGRRRVRSTIAHEIGHAILHEKLFIEKMMFDQQQGLLFGNMERQSRPLIQERIICREPDVFNSGQNSPWYEIQANKFMAELLMPNPLLLQVIETKLSGFDPKSNILAEGFLFENLIRKVSDTFNVSIQMARLAVKKQLEKKQKQEKGGSLL